MRLRRGPAFSGESRGKEHQGSALDPVEVGASNQEWAAKELACGLLSKAGKGLPTSWARGRAGFVPRTRAPAGGAHWQACRAIKQDSHNQRKGSRGKNLFPWHSFPHFLWKKWGPAGGDPNNVAGSLLLSTEKRHLFRDGVFVIHPDRSGGQRRRSRRAPPPQVGSLPRPEGRPTAPW